jgi:hypothetical protein
MKLTALLLTPRRFLFAVFFRVIFRSFTTKCLSPPAMGLGLLGARREQWRAKA